MAYVLVDAAGCDELREALFAMGLKTTDPLMKQRFFEQSEKLAPVVPELPEGCRETERSGLALRVSRGGTTYGISSHGVWNARMGVGHWTPLDISLYLMAHWQSLQGGV
jgi:hypothetical protein